MLHENISMWLSMTDIFIWILGLVYWNICNFLQQSTKSNAQEVYHSSTGKQKATTEKEDDDDGSKIVVDRQGVKTIYTDKFLVIIILVLLFQDT